MKKKKGFTLIELLAVIVVLAIIALIATPIVMNTIKNAKKGAAERSGESYTKQVELTIATEELDKRYVEDGEYKITSDGNLCRDKSATCSDKDKITIEMSGTKPSGGTVKIEKGQVSTTGTSMKFGDYTVSYDSTKKTYVATEKAGNNVEILCTANTTKVMALVYNNSVGGYPLFASSYKSEEAGLLASESGSYTAGVTYTCNVGDGERTFYVLKESGDNVSLILGTNLGDTVTWSSDGSNANGPVTAKAYLEEQTSGWTKLNSSQISLPSAEQIATASGKTFDASSTSAISELPTWLHSYTDENVTYGYWTSTPNASDSSIDWYVTCDGDLHSSANYYGRSFGVRPVITIPKTELG